MKNGIVARKLTEMEETLRGLREHLPTDYEDSAETGRAKKLLREPSKL